MMLCNSYLPEKPWQMQIKSHTGLSSSATTLQEDWIKCKYKTKVRLCKCFLIKIFLRKGAAQLSPAEDWSSNQRKQASLVTCHASTHGQQASNFMSCFWGGVSTYLQAGEERNRFILPHLQRLSWILDRATLAGPTMARNRNPSPLTASGWMKK